MSREARLAQCGVSTWERGDELLDCEIVAPSSRLLAGLQAFHLCLVQIDGQRKIPSLASRLCSLVPRVCGLLTHFRRRLS